MSTGKLRYLFNPLRIGAMEVKNRLVMASKGTSLANPEGKVTPSRVSYYQARARGGVGLIITDDATITSSSIYHPRGPYPPFLGNRKPNFLY